MRKPTHAAVLVPMVLALLASACSSPKATTPKVTDTGVEQTAFNYYVSKERRAPLQAALDTVGMKIAQDLVAKRIPSATHDWSKTKPAPKDGYGMLHSVPSEGPIPPGGTYVSVHIKFTGGQPDLSGGILRMSIMMGTGKSYALEGTRTLTSEGKLVTNTTTAYIWHSAPPPMGFYLTPRDAKHSGIPVWEQPLRSDIAYKVCAQGDDRVATVDDIKKQDKIFLDGLRNLNLNGSVWK